MKWFCIDYKNIFANSNVTNGYLSRSQNEIILHFKNGVKAADTKSDVIFLFCRTASCSELCCYFIISENNSKKHRKSQITFFFLNCKSPKGFPPRQPILTLHLLAKENQITVSCTLKQLLCYKGRIQKTRTNDIAVKTVCLLDSVQRLMHSSTTDWSFILISANQSTNRHQSSTPK